MRTRVMFALALAARRMPNVLFGGRIIFAGCGSVLLSLSLCVAVSAQYRASVQGTVTDQNGATVAGVKVTVTNEDTGVSHETVTGSEGFYRVSELPPGKYSVTVEAPGFKRSVSNGIVVEAEQPRGFDVTLTVGEVQESVTVEASADALHTENANTSGTITTQEIQRLPQFGRDPYELIHLTPGVFGDGSRAANGQANDLPNSTGPGGSAQSIFQIENQVQVVANGQRSTSNNFTIDGVSVNSLGWGGTAVITPNQDSVQEITVLSSSYSAEDGRGSGAHVKVVSKSGTNQLHGAGFFNYQNPNWNAFNKWGGPLRTQPVRVNNKYRQFGASLGGPIRKEKMFYFFSYEGLRSNNLDVSNPLWVETPEFRQLVASVRPNSIAAKVLTSPGVLPRIANVLNSSCTVAGLSDTQCKAVDGGRALDIGSPFGSQGQYVPDPPNPAAFVGGGLDGIPDIQLVTLWLPNTIKGNQYNGKVDYTLGHNLFAFSSYFSKADNFGSDAGGRSRPQGDISRQPLNQTEAFSYIRTFSPTVVNEFRMNFTRFHYNQVLSNPNVNFGIPRIEIERYTFDRIRFGPPRASTTPGILTQNTFNFRDKLSRLIRTHALSFGAEFSAEQDNNNLLGDARPIYSFGRVWNFVNDTPLFEAISANPRNGGPADAQTYLRSKTYAFFFQDDWKVKPNFTLNLGLRYEYFAPLSDAKGQLSNLVIGPGGVLTTAKVVPVERLVEPDRHSFGPQLGFAWSPARLHGNTVLRGGFGVAYNRPDDILFTNARANPPRYARFSLGANDGILYTLGSSNSPTSYPANPELAFGIDPITGGVCGNKACTAKPKAVEIYGGNPNYRNAYVYIYSLEVEHRLPWRLIASAGYQGSAGHKLTRLVNQNFLQKPSPSFSAVYFPTSDLNSNFNALNLELRKQLSHGLLFHANYRYSKSIDQLSNQGPGGFTNQTDPAHPQTEHGPSDFDVAHNFTLYSLWDLPVFRTRSDWVGKVLGGWQINGVLSRHTGFPWTPVTGRINSVPVTDAFSISPVRPTAVFSLPGRDTSNKAYMTPDANFPGIVHGNCPPSGPSSVGKPYYEICNPGPPVIGRNSFRGPGYFNVDFSVTKRFGLPSTRLFGEGANIELRGNFFNVFNKLNLRPINFGSDNARIESTVFGRSPGATAGRVIEFHARFSF